MNRLGYGSGPEDGILGPITDGAIKRMQKFLGTDQDGLVGPKTRALLNNSCKGNSVEKAGDKDQELLDTLKKQLEELDIVVEEKPKTELDTKQCPFFTEYYKRGEKGGEIPKIQTFLKEQGFKPGVVDGIMGPETIASIERFQEKYSEEILKP